MDQATAFRELWGIFRRRLPILLVIGLLGIGASGFIAYILPPVYQSEARILVESQQIPDALARSTVTTSAAERLQFIQQRLMTRDNLLRVIDDLGIFDDRPDLTLSEKITLLRNATQIRPIELIVSKTRRRRIANGELSAFTITVTFPNAAMAARIANEFVTTVLDQNLRSRTERASETLTFFEQEEGRLSDALNALEVEITTYKNENELALPESLDFRREELARAAATDIEIDRKLLEMEEQRASLQATLSQLEIVGTPKEQQSPEEQQLRQLENLLVQKRAVFAEGHREIKAIKAQIAALEATRPQPTGEEGESSADLLSIQKDSVKRQIALLDTQITLLRDQKAELETRKLALQGSIQQTPNIEMTLNAYYRKRQDLQEQLANVVKKRAEAQTGEKLEQNQQAERFEVIENALVADKPISPNRKKILALGSAASVGLALALAFLVEMLNPAIRSAAQLERKLDLRPVVTIPYIQTSTERRRRRLMLVILFLVIGVGVPALLAAIDQYYLPLDLLGVKLAERTGLDEVIRILEQRL
ncbi:hypothetical protein KHP62_20200 [Rhodobacteraceae bacterium NNCM2]|nr:hypothetical protein [Coraliihabitans acroporae]